MRLVIALLLSSLFLANGRSMAKDLFDQDDRTLINYYKSDTYFFDQQKELFANKSRVFFKKILKSQVGQEKKTLMSQLSKKDIWKKIDLMDNELMQKSIIYKLLDKGWLE